MVVWIGSKRRKLTENHTVEIRQQKWTLKIDDESQLSNYKQTKHEPNTLNKKTEHKRWYMQIVVRHNSQIIQITSRKTSNNKIKWKTFAAIVMCMSLAF